MSGRGTVVQKGPLLQVGVTFKLVDGRTYLRKLHQFFQMVDLKITDPDGTKTPLPVACFQCPPRGLPALHGPVNQKQINMIRLQQGEALLNGLGGAAGPDICMKQFRGQKELLPGQAAAGDGPAHAVFVSLASRCVNMPVAGLQRPCDCLLRLRAAGAAKNAPAHGRIRGPACKGNRRRN